MTTQILLNEWLETYQKEHIKTRTKNGKILKKTAKSAVMYVKLHFHLEKSAKK